MTFTTFLHRYIFRGLAPMFVFAGATVIWTSCQGHVDQKAEKRIQEDTGKNLDALHKDADKAIRDFRIETKKPGKKENPK
jgi:hypothetical protein